MTTAANGRKGPRHSFEEVVGISIHHDFVRAWCSSSLFLAGWGDRVRKQLGGFVRVVCRWMEIFRKQTLTPGLHNAAAAAAARSGSSSSSTAAVGGGSSSSSRGRNGRPTLRLPKTTKITSVPRGFGSASAFEWRAFCKCSASVGDGLRTRVPNAPQPMAPSRGATAASFTVDHRENFSRRRHAVSLVEAGPFREGFERLFGVTHFRKCGGRRRGRPVIALSSLNGKDGTGEGNVDLELEVFRFMQQSGRLDAFPTRQELVLAGRTDLAKAIDAEGGWLAAGWEEEVESISSNDSCGGGDFSTTADARGSAAAARGEEKDSSFHQKRFRRKSKTRSLKRNSSTAAGKSTRVRTDERSQGTLERRLNGTDVIQEGVNAVGDEDGRKKGNRLTVLDIDGSEPFEDSSVLERAQRLPYKEKSAVVHRTKKPSRRVTSNDDLQDLEILSSLLSFAEELKVRKCCIKCKKAAPATWSLENMQWIKNMLKRPQRQDQWDGSLGQDSSAKNDFAKGVIETKTISGKTFRKNGFQMETVVEAFPAEKSLLDSRDAITDVAAALPTRKANSRKKEPAKVVEEKSTNDEVKGTSDWIQSIFDKRENWMLQARSKSGDNSFGASVLVDSKYMQNRIRKLAANLAETREALQSGREALWQTDEEVHQGAISELIDAEDTLEFRENAIKHARNELNTARAQVAALEVNLGVEMMEARKILEEKNHQTERARSFSTHLRTARIVWPNHANEVFLTGSFDGWNGQMKLEKSNAGVFVVSLPLYPGRYEIKFVVDGSWRVDTKRPIVYVGGFENNVLVVS